MAFTLIQMRRGTAANWTSANPTLAAGEIGFETDTGRLKIGDGATAWSSLAYYSPNPTTRPGSRTISVLEPQAGDEVGFYLPRPITLDELLAVLAGSDTPGVTWTLRFAADRSAAGTEVVTGGTTTTNTTTGQSVTSFDAASIASGHCWLEIASVAGTVDIFELTLDFTESLA